MHPSQSSSDQSYDVIFFLATRSSQLLHMILYQIEETKSETQQSVGFKGSETCEEKIF